MKLFSLLLNVIFLGTKYELNMEIHDNLKMASITPYFKKNILTKKQITDQIMLKQINNSISKFFSPHLWRCRKFINSI